MRRRYKDTDTSKAWKRSADFYTEKKNCSLLLCFGYYDFVQQLYSECAQFYRVTFF